MRRQTKIRSPIFFSARTGLSKANVDGHKLDATLRQLRLPAHTAEDLTYGVDATSNISDLGRTWPFKNDWATFTGQINPTSMIYEKSIDRVAGETGLRREVVKAHTIDHETIGHKYLMNQGYLALDYFSKITHETFAERITLEKENDPYLSAFLGVEFWGKFWEKNQLLVGSSSLNILSKDQSRNPAYDELGDISQKSIVQTFGERGHDFLAEYKALTDDTYGHNHQDHVWTYLDLIRKYAPNDPGAENRLANNYARNLRNA